LAPTDRRSVVAVATMSPDRASGDLPYRRLRVIPGAAIIRR
jgi:hypothetical protein